MLHRDVLTLPTRRAAQCYTCTHQARDHSSPSPQQLQHTGGVALGSGHCNRGPALPVLCVNFGSPLEKQG